jgi:molybdopterin synthase sulfur carrier subunit
LNVTVKTFADFRELLGKELVMSIPEGETVRGLLQKLGNENAAFLSKVLGSDRNLRPAINILQNGRNILSLHGIETCLAEGDVIAIFPPVAGG